MTITHTKHYYEVLVREENNKIGWKTAMRVPICQTLEEAECYLKLIKLGRWRINDNNKDGAKEFASYHNDYRIFETTINTVEVENTK
jgi:hypothetical protein